MGAIDGDVGAGTLAAGLFAFCLAVTSVAETRHRGDGLYLPNPPTRVQPFPTHGGGFRKYRPSPWWRAHCTLAACHGTTAPARRGDWGPLGPSLFGIWLCRSHFTWPSANTTLLP